MGTGRKRDWLGGWDSYKRAHFNAYKREVCAALAPFAEARAAVIETLEREMPRDRLATELVRDLRQLDTIRE